jgi:hypothetical protein
MLVNVIWYGVFLIVAGVVTMSTPDWVRKLYTRMAKDRGTTPVKRGEWQQAEQRMGAIFIAVGAIIIVLRLMSSSLVIDLVAAALLFAMIAWRVFSFMAD